MSSLILVVAAVVVVLVGMYAIHCMQATHLNLVGKTLLDKMRAAENPTITIDTHGVEATAREAVMNAIRGATAISSGQIQELVGYLKLKSEYDRLIPMNGLSDFLGIKLEGEDAKIEFIEIKSGKGRLTEEQQKMRALINAKKVSFKVVVISKEVIG